MGLGAQPHAELDLIPCVLDVVPSGQLIEPRPVELRPPEAGWLGCWDAFDQAAVGQVDLVQRLVVVLDQRGWDDGHQARVALKAGRADI